MSRNPLFVAGALALASVLPAQLSVGENAPAFDIKKGWNDAPVSFAELKGKVVLIEFFATW